jgi:hypothetical protein
LLFTFLALLIPALRRASFFTIAAHNSVALCSN